MTVGSRRGSRSGGARVWLLAAWAVAASASARGPAVARGAEQQRCVHPTDELSGAVQLRRGCVYDQSFRIWTSNTTLSCDGAVLRAREGYALTVTGDVDGVTVQDCYVEGGQGVAVRVLNRRDGETDDALRARAPREVVLRRLHVSGSDNVGVYLHQHTIGVTVRESIIEGNSSAGAYLAPYGRGHRLLDNRIADNGHVTPEGRPRVGWYRREGVAVDASSEHLIEGNDIIGNAFGGVLLYKNCEEHAAENPDSRPRTEHARAVVIRGNRFADQPFGVWVAARQSRDLSQMGCGDPTPYDNPLVTTAIYHPTYREYASAYTDFELPWVSVWPDFAEDAVVERNTFERIERGGVRVEDDRARVAGNLFVGDFDYVFVGAPFRARLAGQPVADTLIVDNSYASLVQPPAADFAARLALIPGEHTGTRLERNHRACAFGAGWLRHGEATTASTDACASLPRCRDGAIVTGVADDCDATSDAGPGDDPDAAGDDEGGNASDTVEDGGPAADDERLGDVDAGPTDGSPDEPVMEDGPDNDAAGAGDDDDLDAPDGDVPDEGAAVGDVEGSEGPIGVGADRDLFGSCASGPTVPVTGALLLLLLSVRSRPAHWRARSSRSAIASRLLVGPVGPPE